MISYSDITFVIPTKCEKFPLTWYSIPERCKYVFRRDKTRGEARNKGAHEVITEYLIFADDDIEFDEQFLDFALSQLKDKTIVGLEAYFPSPLIISRFMLMTKETYLKVGDMLPVQHGEETEWLIRAIKKGYKLVKLPREAIYHKKHEKSKYKNEIKNILWLFYKHPTFFLSIIKNCVKKIRYSDY